MAAATKAQDVDTIRRIAETIGVPPRTLYSAVERGEIPIVPLAAGTQTIRLADAKRWAAVPRVRGKQRA